MQIFILLFYTIKYNFFKKYLFYLMSDVSLTAQVWSCAHPKINGEHAERVQSARTFDTQLNLASGIYKDANDAYSGRPSYHNAANGTNGLYSLGYAGLNPTAFINLENDLRQVEYLSTVPNTSFYDTLEGANRAAWTSQRAGSSGGMCGMYNGPDAYVNVPVQNPQPMGLNSVQRKNYLAALYSQYRKN